MLTQALGVGWDSGATQQGMRKHEMTGIAEALIAEFSQRPDMIEAPGPARLSLEVRQHHAG
jgi:hypothetical protein